MIKLVSVVIIVIIGFVNSNIRTCFSNSEEGKINRIINEDFISFFEEFCFNKDFQIKRIKFPLKSIHYNEEYTKLDTSYIQKEEWVHKRFYFGPNDESYGQIYDSFEHKLQDTNERVFAWHGLGNGIQIFYYFKRIEGKWYLIKEEDLST